MAESTIRKTRLENNVKSVLNYRDHFAHKLLEVKSVPTMDLFFDPIIITAAPDLYVMESGQEKIIKLGFNKDELDSEIIKIICQCLFEAQSELLGLNSNCVLYWDITRGNVHKGARLGSVRRKQILAACKSIASVWPDIEKNE